MCLEVATPAIVTDSSVKAGPVVNVQFLCIPYFVVCDLVSYNVHDEVPAQDTVDEVEDYVTADLRPRTQEAAAFQSGRIPSNTADVLAARFGRR